MNTQAIADRLVSLCREARWEEAQRELYAGDAISLEPYPTPVFAQETRGLAALQEKIRTFNRMIEQLHSVVVSEPLVAGNAFTCRMQMDVTMKGEGRMTMAELCVYRVKDGKIISEQFFV